MYHIGICDDGENICTSIENMLLRYAEEKTVQVEVQIWYTGEGLKDYLERGNHLDIIFLDIELFKMTGIEVGSYIRNELDNMGLQIIYISGKCFDNLKNIYQRELVLWYHINVALFRWIWLIYVWSPKFTTNP